MEYKATDEEMLRAFQSVCLALDKLNQNERQRVLQSAGIILVEDWE